MSSPLSAVAKGLISEIPHRLETGRKQLTLALGGLYIASTTTTAKPFLIWETEKSYPRYYIPTASLHDDVRWTVLSDDPPARNGGLDIKVEVIESVTGELKGARKVGPFDNKTEAVIERLTVGEKSTTWVRFLAGPLKGFIRFERSELDTDQWFENGALFAGIKNPYKRIDTTAVSHHIVVKVDGETVAETNVAVLLNETGLTETYYLPATSILNWGAVENSDLRTACPYKGEAWYFSLNVKGKKHENLIWHYPYPTHESAAVQGFISFYNKENVEILVDGIEVSVV